MYKSAAVFGQAAASGIVSLSVLEAGWHLECERPSLPSMMHCSFLMMELL